MPIKTKLKKVGGTYDFIKFLNNSSNFFSDDDLHFIASDALRKFVDASPNEEIANNWSYEIEHHLKTTSLIFCNSTIQNGTNIAIVIDVGHGTKNGHWVEGTHYLDKATKEAYDTIINETWEALYNERG